MTKTMKRFISILISVVMILTLGMAVMAADPTYPVTVTKANSSDKYIHDLELYQIFDAKGSSPVTPNSKNIFPHYAPSCILRMISKQFCKI